MVERSIGLKHPRWPMASRMLGKDGTEGEIDKHRYDSVTLDEDLLVYDLLKTVLRQQGLSLTRSWLQGTHSVSPLSNLMCVLLCINVWPFFSEASLLTVMTRCCARDVKASSSGLFTTRSRFHLEDYRSNLCKLSNSHGWLNVSNLCASVNLDMGKSLKKARPQQFRSYSWCQC